MTREEHLKWCKERAIQEYDFYAKESSAKALQNGLTSMMSDLMKHQDTSSQALQSLLMMQMMDSKPMLRQQFVNFINGFN